MPDRNDDNQDLPASFLTDSVDDSVDIELLDEGGCETVGVCAGLSVYNAEHAPKILKRLRFGANTPRLVVEKFLRQPPDELRPGPIADLRGLKYYENLSRLTRNWVAAPIMILLATVCLATWMWFPTYWVANYILLAVAVIVGHTDSRYRAKQRVSLSRLRDFVIWLKKYSVNLGLLMEDAILTESHLHLAGTADDRLRELALVSSKLFREYMACNRGDLKETRKRLNAVEESQRQFQRRWDYFAGLDLGLPSKLAYLADATEELKREFMEKSPGFVPVSCSTCGTYMFSDGVKFMCWNCGNTVPKSTAPAPPTTK